MMYATYMIDPLRTLMLAISLTTLLIWTATQFNIN